MKLLLIFFLSLNGFVFGQTKLIAFKSHAGNMLSFTADGIDNIGLPSLSIDTLKLLNDSTIIEIRSRGRGWDKQTDTVVNHPVCKIPHLTVDTLKGMYYRRDIEFVGFDTILTKKEIRRQKKWKKSQERLKRKRTKLLKKYKAVDDKIIEMSGTLLLGDDNNDDNSLGNTTVGDGDILKAFGFGLTAVMLVFVLILYILNRSKVVAK